MPPSASRKRAAPGADTFKAEEPVTLPDNNINNEEQARLANQFWTGFGLPNTNSAAVTSNNLSLVPNRQPTMNSTNTNYSDFFPDWNNTGANAASGKPQADDEEKIEARAAEAKRNAEISRKNLPPFVVKLKSFLDDSSNANLIRWSNDGQSFIVLDEDEFAKTLIPELFKHNKYSSFVRQLNMYGFHKQVGLSDNSMRQSERKNKNPSEFKHPFFRRDKPDLMWLMEKSKSTTSKPRGSKKDGAGDGNEDDALDAEEIFDPDAQFGNGTFRARPQLMLEDGTSSMQISSLPIVQKVQKELQTIQRQQIMITEIINRVRAENLELKQQASTFQEIHNRHESSINAILTFLATMYSRSLNGQNSQDMAGMLSGLVQEMQQQQNHPPQGSVVDLDNVESPTLPKDLTQQRRTPRRPLLLQAPENPSTNTRNSTTPSKSSRSGSETQRFTPVRENSVSSTAGMANDIEELIRQTLSNNPQQRQESNTPTPSKQNFLNLINSTNAQGSENFPQGLDFSQALSHLQTADGKAPLSNNERSKMLRRMASGSTNGSGQSNNGLMQQMDVFPMNKTPDFAANSDNLDLLQKLQQDQNSRFDNVQNLLRPLSPGSSIPGFAENGDTLSTSGDGNLENWFVPEVLNSDGGINFTNPNDVTNSNDDFNAQFQPDGLGNFNFGDLSGGQDDANDFNFTDNGDQGRIVGTVNSSEAASPAADVEQEDKGKATAPANKKRKR